MSFKENFPKLKSERLVLRQIVSADLPTVFKALSHPDIIKYYGVQYHSLEATKEQMKWFADLEANETGIWWAVCGAEDNTFYGAGGLNDWSKEHRKAEIGFWLFPDYWGQGIMKEAMKMICDFAFNELGLHRIEGYVENHNTNCKKAIAKLNFTLEGTMQDCEVKDGAFVSVDIYALLNKK